MCIRLYSRSDFARYINFADHIFWLFNLTDQIYKLIQACSMNIYFLFDDNIFLLDDP